MNIELINLKDSIINNDSISFENKEKLISYIELYLYKRIRVFTSDDYSKLDYILKDINYEFEDFDKLLYTAFKIRNSIGSKNKVKYTTVPTTDYVLAVYKIFKELNMDLKLYDKDDGVANVAIARTVLAILNGMEDVNKVSFLDAAKDIYEMYCSPNDINKSMCTILKLLNRVKKGFYELNGEYDLDIYNDEFYSMFEYMSNVDLLNISDLIKEYYPIFEKELFSLIKNVVSNSSIDDISTEYVMGYLNNIISKRKMMEVQRETILNEVELIDVEVENNVEQAFANLLNSIENNSNINVSVKNAVLNNVKDVFERYRKEQFLFVNNELDSFFNNCSNYVNDLIIPAGIKDSEINQLITILVNNCKNFFVEYDSKKFKEIVNYILENTDISIEQLKLVGDNCSSFFKDADVSKLSVINTSLKEFKNYVSKNYKDSDFVTDIFEHVLINNPELMVNSDKLGEVIAFLKGEISLTEYGYQYSNFCIRKDFLSHNFFKKMKEDNYRILFEGSIGKFINNLNYLNEKCESFGIDFTNFNFNDSLVYSLLNNDFYNEGTNSLTNIVSLFDIRDLKNLIELNPDLFRISSEQLEMLASKCLLNENEDYNFYDLLASELYFYDYNSFADKTNEDIVNGDIKFISLGINRNKEFDVTDILTSHLFKSSDSDFLFQQYEDRIKTKETLEELLVNLEDTSISNPMDLYRIIQVVKELYDSIYSKVPNISFKNKVIDVLSAKKEKCEYDISDLFDEVEEKKNRIKSYDIEMNDNDFVISELKDLMSKVKSKITKAELEKTLVKFRNEKARVDQKHDEIIESIRQIESSIQLMEKQVEKLNYFLSVVDMDNVILIEEKKSDVSKTFTIKDLNSLSYDSSERNEKILEAALNGKNLIIFADQVDLNEIPNDKNFVDKIYKFLGDGEFSISSPQFMKINSLNKEFVEKFTDHRSEIFSRRESRTPVRVYFIPVHNKYFDCYYVVGVNYKDHNHIDGGCSTDEVYNRRLKEVKVLEETISRLGESDINRLNNWIRTYKEIYNNQMEPIIAKIEILEKKRNNKK